MLKIVLCSTAIVLLPCAALLAQERATPEEVVQKVKEAAQILAGAGEAGLAAFQSGDPAYVWKDSYVVVNDCAEMTVAAHPVRPELAGSSMTDMPSFGEIEPGKLGGLFCESGERPQGGWVEYLFPKPGEKEPARKISYSKAAEGTPYVVSGGVYSDELTVEELERIVGD
jgi:cytochrome c